jgi:hypothetical protein
MEFRIQKYTEFRGIPQTFVDLKSQSLKCMNFGIYSVNL